MTYRKELIQVAAVAIAAVQNFENGDTELNEETHRGFEEMEDLIDRVRQERYRQEQKWGVQAHHPRHWLTILTEEVGEVARAILENDL